MSKTLSLHSSRNVSDQVLHPYKTAGKMTQSSALYINCCSIRTDRRAEEWTDRHDEANSRFLQFCERARKDITRPIILLTSNKNLDTETP